jgi:protein-S-isoprenylcysteine O-methyltransferase Ste14
MNRSRLVLSRRNLLSLFVADVVLFVLSNVTSKSNSHPGTASNVLWIAFLVGVLALIVLGVATLVQSRRSRAS